jgi:hypothetical protein
MHIIAFIAIIVDCFLVGWLESVGSRVVYELDYKKPILYVVLIQSILGKLPWYLSVTLELFRTECATPFWALPATAGRAQAMGAGCGSSTRGHWDGPVTCNKSHGIHAREAAGRKVRCEHDASPCLGHAIVCSGCLLTILVDGKINIRPNIGLWSVPIV